MANQIEGKVAAIGEQGNLVTDISVDQVAVAPRDESTTVKFGDHETIGLYPSNHDQPDATLVACLGKSGFVEIEIAGLNLAEMLGIKLDEPVVIRW